MLKLVKIVIYIYINTQQIEIKALHGQFTK